MKKNEDDKLKSLFHTIELESPSMSFENKLMARVYQEHAVAQKKRSRMTVLAMLSGIVAAVFIPFVTLSFFGWSIADVAGGLFQGLFSSFSHLNIGFSTLMIPLVCFILLVLDTILRHRLWEKENKQAKKKQ